MALAQRLHLTKRVSGLWRLNKMEYPVEDRDCAIQQNHISNFILFEYALASCMQPRGHGARPLARPYGPFLLSKVDARVAWYRAAL